VPTAFEQHPAAQMDDHDSCNSANEHVLESRMYGVLMAM
jgi:hypothetical protein